MISIFEGHYIHDFQPIDVLGDPGWSCATCGIWKQCSPTFFRIIFGVSFQECMEYVWNSEMGDFAYQQIAQRKKKPGRVGGRIKGHRRRA